MRIINKIKIIITGFILELILTFLLTILNYFNIISKNTINIISYIFTFIIIFVISKIVNHSNSKCIEGIKLGLFFIIISLLLNLLLFKNGFTTKNIIFYCIYIISSILGVTCKFKHQKK